MCLLIYIYIYIYIYTYIYINSRTIISPPAVEPKWERGKLVLRWKIEHP